MRDERDAAAAQPEDGDHQVRGARRGRARASLETNLPASELDTFAQLALQARSQPIGSVSFVPPAINTADPDIDKIRDMISAAIDRSEGTDGPGRREAHQGLLVDPGRGEHGRFASAACPTGYAANRAQNLSQVC